MNSQPHSFKPLSGHRHPRARYIDLLQSHRLVVFSCSIQKTGSFRGFASRFLPTGRPALRSALRRRVAGITLAILRPHDPVSSMFLDSAALAHADPCFFCGASRWIHACDCFHWRTSPKLGFVARKQSFFYPLFLSLHYNKSHFGRALRIAFRLNLEKALPNSFLLESDSLLIIWSDSQKLTGRLKAEKK